MGSSASGDLILRVSSLKEPRTGKEKKKKKLSAAYFSFKAYYKIFQVYKNIFENNIMNQTT